MGGGGACAVLVPNRTNGCGLLCVGPCAILVLSTHIIPTDTNAMALAPSWSPIRRIVGDSHKHNALS